MKKSKFSEEQIVRILQEIEACAKVSDALWSGRRFRTFNVNDDFNRQSLRIEIDMSLPSQRVIRVLDELVELRDAPRRLRLDNGPEFISAALKLWAQRHGVELLAAHPGG